MSQGQRKLVVFYVLGLGTTCLTGCAKPSPRASEARSEASDSCARQIRSAPKTTEKLSGHAQQAWTQWQLQVCWARTGKYPTLNREEIERRRVSVVVTFRGDLDRLRATGLSTGFSSEGRVSGIVACSKLESLTAVEGVQEIDVEPEMKLFAE